MSVNFGSELLDVIFALAFIYFLLSLIVSAGTEAISWFLQKRAKNLEDGLKTLLSNGDGSTSPLAQDLLAHPLVKGANKERKRLPNVDLPSYVSPRNFALALVDVLTEPGATLDATVAGLPAPIKDQLHPLLSAAAGDIGKFRESVEHWYDDAMDRVAGWYKRWALLVTIVLATAVTLAFNVDTIRVTERLFNDENVRDSVTLAAERSVQEGAKPGEPGAVSPTKAGEKAEEATDTLTALKLPIGWDAANTDWSLSLFAGWLVTAIAISLGAPFWFGALGSLANLRATGAKPKAKNGSG
jgi:hypothetical protein